MKKRLKQLNKNVQIPVGRGQDIHLQLNDEQNKDPDEASVHYSDLITVVLGIITMESSVLSVGRYPDKLNIQMRIDACADTCVLTMNDLQRLGFCFEIKPCNAVLNGCRGTSTCNFGATTLKVTFKDNSELSKFIIVKAPAAGHPSMTHRLPDCTRIRKHQYKQPGAIQYPNTIPKTNRSPNCKPIKAHML